MEEKKNYRKNSFNLDKEQKESIIKAMAGYMDLYGYSRNDLY
jgi:hypothetical protein